MVGVGAGLDDQLGARSVVQRTSAHVLEWIDDAVDAVFRDDGYRSCAECAARECSPRSMDCRVVLSRKRASVTQYRQSVCNPAVTQDTRTLSASQKGFVVNAR